MKIPTANIIIPTTSPILFRVLIVNLLLMQIKRLSIILKLFFGKDELGINLEIQFYSLSNNENLHVSLSSDYFFVSDLKS